MGQFPLYETIVGQFPWNCFKQQAVRFHFYGHIQAETCLLSHAQAVAIYISVSRQSKANFQEMVCHFLQRFVFFSGHVGWMENGDECGSTFTHSSLVRMNGGWIISSSYQFIPHLIHLSSIHPLFITARNKWVKVYPHSSPFSIHLLCPG